MSGQANVQMRVDIGLRPGNINPHTFIAVTHPDGRQTEYGLVPASPGSPSGTGQIEVTGRNSDKGQPAEYDLAGPKIPLTDPQYRELMREIENSIQTPPDYILPGSWWPENDGTNCTGWVVDIWKKVGLPSQFGVTNAWVWNPFGQGLFISIHQLYNSAKNWVWPRDPIILDLDGNGLETVGLNSNIHFDHDGDGVLTRTGWVGRDDALLVWDRNANGAIDTGAELFGDFTPLANGTLAPNGFAALAALDENGDGVIDASDPVFSELRLWRDADQNGVTGAGELITLADAGIVSLNLANTLKNQGLGNGNTLAREGSFTRADGSTSAMGEFHFAIDTFSTKFAEQVEVPEALKSLPNMAGTGNVRELQQAAAQSGDLAGVLAQFQSAGTRAEQMALLDHVITAWAGASGMGSLEERASGKYRIIYEAFGNVGRSSNIDTAAFAAISSGSVGSGTALLTDLGGTYLSERYRNLISEWCRKLYVLEAFNGQYFFNLPETKSQSDGANNPVWEKVA